MAENPTLISLLSKSSTKNMLRQASEVDAQIEKRAGKPADELGEDVRTALLREFRGLQISRQLEDLVLRELPRPAITTKKDLVATAMLLLLGNNQEDFEYAYDQFTRIASERASIQRHSKIYRAATGYFFSSFPGMETDLWKSSNGFKIIVTGSIPIEIEGDPCDWPEDRMPICARHSLFIRVSAKCTKRALREFSVEAKTALRTILKTLEILRKSDPQETLPYNLFSVNDTEEEQQQSEVVEGSSPYGPPDVSSRTWMIPKLLDCYFLKIGKKDTLDRRIRNALYLLIEADAQRHHAISLSLAMSAIEALVCRKKSEISKQLSDNVAILLEPDRDHRRECSKFVKKLYNARSRTLHGEHLEQERESQESARKVASAVLLAIVERRQFQRRTGVETESPNELLDELETSLYRGSGEVPGVSPTPIRTLWRPDPLDRFK